MRPDEDELALWRAMWARNVALTDALRERRCRPSRRFDAHVARTLATFRPLFAPWNMEVVFALHIGGPRRFGELKRALTGISSRVLTDKLRHLAREGLLGRREDGRAVVYALTRRGEAVARHLHPLLFYLHHEDALV